MPLRKILYADTEALDNYVSMIDGYVYEEATITKNVSNTKEANVRNRY